MKTDTHKKRSQIERDQRLFPSSPSAPNTMRQTISGQLRAISLFSYILIFFYSFWHIGENRMGNEMERDNSTNPEISSKKKSTGPENEMRKKVQPSLRAMRYVRASLLHRWLDMFSFFQKEKKKKEAYYTRHPLICTAHTLLYDEMDYITVK